MIARFFCLLSLAVLPLLAGGCETLEKAIGRMDKPTATITDVRFKDLTAGDMTMLFDVAITNPYAVPIPLTNVSYGLGSGGTQFLTGAAKSQTLIPAQGRTIIEMPAKVNFAKTIQALSGVRPGAVVPYDAALTLSLDTPGNQTFELPVKKSGELPIPAPPTVAVEGINVDSLGLDKSSATVKLKLTNPNQFGVDLSKMSYGLSLGGSEVAAGKIGKALKFDPNGGSGTLEIPISVSIKSAGMAVYNMLRGGEASYRIKGDMNLGSRFGPLDMGYDSAGKTTVKGK